MAQDKDCPLNIEGICFETVAYGFHEKQLREEGRMKPCDMGRNSYGEITTFCYCSAYGSFQTAWQTPGTIHPRCYKAIRDAKYNKIIDGQVVDLKSHELLIHKK
jgi:hypothetical protein